MRKKLLILGAIFVVAIPLVAFAALVPCGLSENIQNPVSCSTGTNCPDGTVCPANNTCADDGRDESASCTLCHTFVLGKNITNFLALTIAPALAVLAFALAGFKILISGGSPGQRQEGIKIIRNTIIGLLIVFGAWIIINELLLFFAGGTETARIRGFLMPWDTITCIAPLVTAPTVVSVAYDKEGSERIALNNAGITVRTNYCKTFDGPDINNNPCCTTVAGLSSSAITALINLKNDCGCSIEVTGGTEKACHTSHGPSYPTTVDILYTSTLSNYLFSLSGGEDNYTTTANPQGRRYVNTSTGAIYLLEYKNNAPNHWHIVF